ncbi:MAG: methyltransferase domain-containing protein [Nitrospirae bacterium]|nr:methyltransferase domain-containing protein [Nitrospirota bacterium]
MGQTTHKYLTKYLQNHSIHRGSVLVLGNNPKSLAFQLEQLGFDVQSMPLDHLRNMVRNPEIIMNNLTKTFDIVILDDLLQYLPNPNSVIKYLKKQMARGGILIVTSPNAVRGKIRLKILMGKNSYPLLYSGNGSDSIVFDYTNAFYRESTLEEIRTLLSKESFYVITAYFFNRNSDGNQDKHILRYFYRMLQKIIPSFRNDFFLMARGNFSTDLPTINKMDDFKLTSMHVFNSKWLYNYETPTLFNRFFTRRWDIEVFKQLPVNVSSLRILDVGCGWGRLLTAFADAGALHLAGMDIAPRMVDLVRQRLFERGVTAEVKVGDAEDAIPWEDESFDVITLTGSLHHFYRPFDALREMYRVLNKNGLLIITDPLFFPPIRQILNYLLTFKAAQGDYRFYTPHEVSEMLVSMGFTMNKKQQWINSFLVSALK